MNPTSVTSVSSLRFRVAGAAALIGVLGTLLAPGVAPARAAAPAVTAISAGSRHTCAILASGAVRCWGWNPKGLLGDGTTEPSLAPVAVREITTATAIAAGNSHTCALLADQSVRCWGYNYNGQLGDGSATERHTPVAVRGITTATRIIAGAADYTCALLADRSVRCWGNNFRGQLGDGTTTPRHTPVAALGITTATAIAAGLSHTCAILAAGTVRCWGENHWGQLGNGRTADSATPVAVRDITTATAIAAGDGHTCAILADQSVRCWGHNDFGQLGDGTTGASTTPVVVSGITTATAIAAGGSHTCAILADQSVRCWGWNGIGQLGDGTTRDSTTPVVVSGITTATAIAAGSMHTCALLADQSVRCWGWNGMGQLGDGTKTRRLTPAAVVFDTAAPNVTVPDAAPTPNFALAGAGMPVRIDWTGMDTGGSGISRYALARSTNGGSTWTTLAVSLREPRAHVTVPTSGTVRFRVRAVDRAGNAGAWVSGPTLSSRLVQQTSSAVRYAGRWTGVWNHAYSGGSARSAKVAGAAVAYTFTGRSIALITTKGPTRGGVRVYINGGYQATIDLYRPATRYRVVVWQMTWPTSATRTIRLVVVGTPGRPRVDLDAFGVVK